MKLIQWLDKQGFYIRIECRFQVKGFGVIGNGRGEEPPPFYALLVCQDTSHRVGECKGSGISGLIGNGYTIEEAVQDIVAQLQRISGECGEIGTRERKTSAIPQLEIDIDFP